MVIFGSLAVIVNYELFGQGSLLQSGAGSLYGLCAV
jgi:hypothetical protein